METAARAQQRLVQRMRIRLDEREEGKRHAFATSLQLTFGADIDEQKQRANPGDLTLQDCFQPTLFMAASVLASESHGRFPPECPSAGSQLHQAEPTHEIEKGIPLQRGLSDHNRSNQRTRCGAEAVEAMHNA
jgi:hypothetical protein